MIFNILIKRDLNLNQSKNVSQRKRRNERVIIEKLNVFFENKLRTSICTLKPKNYLEQNLFAFVNIKTLIKQEYYL